MELSDFYALNLTDAHGVDTWARAAHEAIDDIEDRILAVLGDGKFCRRIEPSATIHPTAIIGDYVYVGNNVTIGPYCYVKNHVLLFDGVELGFNVELDRCVLFDGVKIAHTACVGRCIVGQASNLAFGFVTATKNLLPVPVHVVLPSANQMLSHRHHHGTAIGARLTTGVNVSVMPGTTILPDVVVRPHTIVSGFVDAAMIL